MVRNARYDLVLMDLQMPVLGGLEAATRIREFEQSAGRHTPILALTAHAAAQDEQHCLEVGMDGYVVKPIRRELLQKEIARVTNQCQKEKEAPELPLTAAVEVDWNLTELLGRLDDDRTFLSELLRGFYVDSQSNLQQAKSALAGADLGELARAAHTLKGMLRNLFMNRAAESAANLESAARQGKREESEVLLVQLDQALAELLPKVDAQLAEVKR